MVNIHEYLHFPLSFSVITLRTGFVPYSPIHKNDVVLVRKRGLHTEYSNINRTTAENCTNLLSN